MSLAGLFILMGLGPWDPVALAIGVVLALVVFAAAAYLVFGKWSGRPRPRGSGLAMAAVAGYYVIAAIVAAFADTKYVLAALGAGLIPLTATMLLIASARAKTLPGEDDGLDDTTRDQHTDPYPGIGFDDKTPLGDTTEHSDADRPPQRDRRFEPGGSRSRSRSRSRR
jgi:hypothetical protein